MKKLDAGLYEPRDADRLLRDPEVIAEVCSPISNPRGWRPKMTTRARSGQTLPEAFREESSVFDLQTWVSEAVNLPLRHYIAAVEPYTTLAVKRVRKGKGPSMLPPGVNYTNMDSVADLSPPSLSNSGETRPIVVQEAYMRALTNLFAHVLALTCERHIPAVATAYRPGRADPVAATVMPIAKAIDGGHRFFVAVDIKNCFPSLPWKRIRLALREFGYSRNFVSKLMVLVRAPQEEKVRGRWARVKADRGSPAGLSISSILLNILLRDLDQHVHHEYRSRVVYERYSDNLYFAAWSADHLTGAVRFAMRWLKEHGLKLKNVSDRQKPQSLIQDVSKNRIVVLGIEIDEKGRTYRPEKLVEASIQKVEYYRQKLLFAPSYVGAISRYLTGKRSQGIDLRDQEDIDSMIRSTARWIGFYNPEQAQEFLAQVTKGYNHPRSNLGEEQPVYVAALGDVEAPWAEAILTGDDPSGRLDGPTIAGLIQVEDPFGDLSSSEPEETSPMDEEPVGFADEFMSEGQVNSGDDPWVQSYMGASDADGFPVSTGMEVPSPRVGEDLGRDSGDHVHEGEFVANLCGDGASCTKEPSATQATTTVGRTGSSPPTGKTGSGGTAVGVSMASSCPLSQKRVVVSMAHRWLRRRRYTIVGLERLEIVEGDLDGRTAIAVELQDHPFVAGLKVILDEVRAAAAAGSKLVVVRMESAWLAKALIQYDRAVRSIEVGQLVTDLHTEALKLGAVVLIAGPIKAAPAVETAIRRQLLRAEYQEAVDRAARDGIFQRAVGRP